MEIRADGHPLEINTRSTLYNTSVRREYNSSVSANNKYNAPSSTAIDTFTVDTALACVRRKSASARRLTSLFFRRETGTLFNNAVSVDDLCVVVDCPQVFRSSVQRIARPSAVVTSCKETVLLYLPAAGVWFEGNPRLNELVFKAPYYQIRYGFPKVLRPCMDCSACDPD